MEDERHLEEVEAASQNRTATVGLALSMVAAAVLGYIGMVLGTAGAVLGLLGAHAAGPIGAGRGRGMAAAVIGAVAAGISVLLVVMWDLSVLR